MPVLFPWMTAAALLLQAKPRGCAGFQETTSVKTCFLINQLPTLPSSPYRVRLPESAHKSKLLVLE